MIYLIKLIFILFISQNVSAYENNKSEILFKINNKVFTNVDLEKRIEYVALLNNLIPSKFSKSEQKDILNDFISSLIYYEYYIQNKIFFEDINKEINDIYKKKFQQKEKISEVQIRNLKFNTNIDLIRNKLIELNLNSKKNKLLQDVNENDLLYNYNIQHIIIKENLLDKELLKNIKDSNEFNNLKKSLKENKIKFFYKQENINNSTYISNKIKKFINKGLQININNKNGYISIISINKNLVSYEGIFVKLINFKTSKLIEQKDLKCNKLKDIIDINKTVFKEYEYSKLNNNIKNNLKSLNDYVVLNDNGNYNYIVLCDLTYDEKILKNINLNKNINFLVNKIQNNFLKKYKNEYNFIQIK